MLEDKTVIARIKSIKLLTSGFLEILVLSPNCRWWQILIFPLADTHEHSDLPNTETTHQLYLLSLIIK